MTGRLTTLLAAFSRTVFETAAVYLWLGLLAGTAVSFPVILAGAVVLGLAARTGKASRYVGPGAAVAMALIGMVFGIPAYASGPVLLYLAWRMQSVATQTTSTYAIESSFALGLWLFVTGLVALDLLPIHAGLPKNLGGDAFTMVIAGLIAMVLARSENLGILSRLKDSGVGGGLFRRTGMLLIGALALGAFILALIVSPSLGPILGVASAAALFLAYWLIYLVSFVVGFILPIWQWLIGLLAGPPHHQKPQPVSSPVKKASTLIHHPASAHFVEVVLLILVALVALYVLYRVFSRMAVMRQDESLFTDERFAYSARHVGAKASTPAEGWPYSPAGTRLREAVRALEERLGRLGLWPGPSATLREALRGAGQEVPHLVDAYESHRYGEGGLPDDLDAIVREADALFGENDGGSGGPPGGRAG